MSKNSAIVLAGGFSTRLGRDKGLIELKGKPLVLHVLEKIPNAVHEIAVVVSSDIQLKKVKQLLPCKVSVIVDQMQTQSPLAGASAGFTHIQSEYSLLLPCDTPFFSTRVAQLLLDLCPNRDAVIPRWPNGYIEPLQAAYHIKSARKAAATALEEGKLDLRSMISHFRAVRYLSTVALRQVDPDLMSFFNINTPEDLAKAESIFEQP